jgi:hypothetical protein
MLRYARVVSLSILFVACAKSPQAASTGATPASATIALPAAERSAFQSVSEQTIRNVTVTLASPQMEGRGTATPGGERAARWIADRWRALGMQPLGDSGTFLQGIQFVGVTVQPRSALIAGSTRLELGTDWVPYLYPTADSIDITAPVLFVGYGAQSQALGRDDFAGVDPSGKVVVLLANRPPGMDSTRWAQNVSLQRTFGTLITRGARAVLLANTGTPTQPYATVAKYLSRRRVSLAQSATPPGAPVIAFLGPEGATKLWRAAGLDFDASKRQADAGQGASREILPQATIAIRAQVDRAIGSNVVGVLRGSDSARADEAVLYTAHYDAFGIEHGALFPGAADNALGVGMITAIAEAVTKLPQKPRRSMIFLAVTGEEYGLLGAEWWAAHPTWPLARIAANLNHDGIGTETYGPVQNVVGWGGEQSSLGPLMKEIVEATGNRVQADPFPEENVFMRSDHYALVKAGVPALMLAGAPADTTWPARAKAWLEGPYHQPGDSVRTDWNWSGPTEIAAISLVMGLRIANADEMPQWLPSSPFNKPRTGE